MINTQTQGYKDWLNSQAVAKAHNKRYNKQSGRGAKYLLTACFTLLTLSYVLLQSAALVATLKAVI